MKASDHTDQMLRCWRSAGIDRADLAVRRADGVMLWHQDLPLEELPLTWARAENVRRADIYIRPARGSAWPIVFLDDVPRTVALRVAGKYAALVIETSPIGGCHVWLTSRRPLGEEQRKEAQGWLVGRIGGDPGSVSGEHLGRLAGFKNWKRGGNWVNVLLSSGGLAWDAAVALRLAHMTHCVKTIPRRAMPHQEASVLGSAGPDRSESGREWGWVCGQLEAGCDPRRVCRNLVERARQRRGLDAERYASRTMTRALQQVSVPA